MWKEEWRAKEDKWKEDVRTLQLKAEELLMPLTARAAGGSLLVYVCMCARARACVRMCVCVCVRA